VHIVNKIATLSFCTILLINVFTLTFVVISFKANQTFIETYLCINKADPDTTCKGKCFLKKELKKATGNKTPTQVFTHFQSNTEYLLITLIHLEVPYTIKRGNTIEPISTFYKTPSTKVVPPPKLYHCT